MAPMRFSPLIILALSLLAAGCQPKIGDSCITNQDCSGETQRLCDTSQPDGYCTIADCDPTTCPEDEAVCVSFNNVKSTVGDCGTPVVPSPYRRNFCMKYCNRDSDCREDYVCIKVEPGNILAASIIQKPTEKANGKIKDVPQSVCIFAESYPPQPEDRSDQVCTGYDWGAGGAGIGGAGGSADQ